MTLKQLTEEAVKTVEKNGKVMYTEEEAEEKLQKLTQRGNTEGIEKMNTYFCIQGSSFHIGHKNRGCQ